MFAHIPEISNTLLCLRSAQQAILRLYPCDENNNWVQTPPQEILEAIQLIHPAIGHLENLCEHGTASFQLVEDYKT